jgi:hypothetical protein
VDASGVMVGVFLSFRREMERRNVGENRGTKPSSSPIFCVSRGRRKATVPLKRHCFRLFFFFNEQCMKRRRFGKNASFHLNENSAKLISKYKSFLNL